jgi:predicted DNA-binding WGR domain protein
MQRRVYCVGLRKHVEADIDDIVPITGKRGTKYQCVGKYSENGKDYVVKSWVPKADYEALHGAVDIAAAEEFIGADVEAAEPLAADPVADSPVAEDSSEPLEVAPADKSYFLSETVVLSAIKEMAAEDEEPPEKITYDCISCGEEIDDEDGHELVGEFQEKCCLPCVKTAFGAEQTFEAQQKKELDYVSEQAALRLIKGAYGVKRIVSGPTYYRFVEGTSSKFLMFAVVERNNGTFQAVNVYGRRGANFPTLWASDPYQTEAQAERASKEKQNKKSRKGYVFLDAEEFRAFMAEHFNSETLNSRESIDNYMSESPLDESPVDEDPLTADPSDLGGPEDFSADASIDLDDGKITIHEKGVKSGSSKKLLLGVILVAGLAAAYQNSDAVLEFFEGLKGDESDPILGCMDETANNYDATATEDDGTCTYDPDDEPTA